MSFSSDSDGKLFSSSIIDDSHFSDNCYSTISVDDVSTPPHDDANELLVWGIDPRDERRLGGAPGGGNCHSPGVIFDRSGDTHSLEGRANFSCPAEDSRPIPKGRSIAHHSINNGKAVFSSF